MVFNNIFYSIQGEGIHIGKPTIFVRFSGCPFRCPYCDEPQALTEKNGVSYNWEDLAGIIKTEFMRKYNCNYIEMTGGSPEAQNQEDMYKLCKKLKENGSDVRIGMQMSGGLTLSKKLWKIVDYHKIDYKEPICEVPFVIDPNLLTSRDELKFVLHEGNLDWFRQEVEKFQYCGANIIVSPMSNKNSTVESELENARQLTYRVMYMRLGLKIQILPRLQQLYWTNQKGV